MNAVTLHDDEGDAIGKRPILVRPSSKKLKPAKRLEGSLRFPGDKSISHRYAMLAALAEGPSEIHFFSSSADCQSTLNCLQQLGVKISRDGDTVMVQGVGLEGLRPPAEPLDAGNSGTTMRLLSGILAGQPFSSVLVGDASLSRRPMKRIVDPLTLMGAHILTSESGTPPLEIEGRTLLPIRYELPMASAQVTIRCATLLILFQPKKKRPTKVASRKKAISPSMASGAPNTSPT